METNCSGVEVEDLTPTGEQFAIFDSVQEDARRVIEDTWVTTEDGQVFPWAATDKDYEGAVYLSDACESLLALGEAARLGDRWSQDMLSKGPAILKTICSEQYLASQVPTFWADPLHYRQARRRAKLANAEIGQLPHEQRKLRFAEGVEADKDARKRLHNLAPARGGDDEKVIDYGRVDSVALVFKTYEMLLHRLRGTAAYDELFTPFIHSTGVERTLQEALLDGGDWFMRRFRDSKLGLIETTRFFRGDKRNKGWKDSLTAYLHTNGKLVNMRNRIADPEIQGEYYEAILGYIGLLNDTGRSSEVNAAYAARDHLRFATVSYFYEDGDDQLSGIDGRPHFVTAVDRN